MPSKDSLIVELSPAASSLAESIRRDTTLDVLPVKRETGVDLFDERQQIDFERYY
jgi:hypothetical protein